MKRVIFGIVAAVIVVAALFGVGGMAYRMGIAQGAGYAALSLPRGDGAPPPVETMTVKVDGVAIQVPKTTADPMTGNRARR